MTQLASRIGGWGRGLLDVLLPPQCLCCDQPVATSGLLCPSCFLTLDMITAPLCQACGTSLREHPRRGVTSCDDCAEDPPPWRRARAAFQYDGASRSLILPLKYGDRMELAPALARMMARAGLALLEEADLLVPVPMHPRRLRQRKYNQAVLLASSLGRLAHRPVALDGLERRRATRSLAELPAELRAMTVSGAFEINPRWMERLVGRRVVLVDDVLTSGATARACTEVLLGGGVACVDVLVAARTAGRG